MPRGVRVGSAIAAVLVAMLGAVVGCAGAAGAVAGPTHVITGPGHAARWDAAVPNGAVPDPALCSPSTCSMTNIVLRRPADRLVVAIDTSQMENTFDFLYDVRLYVYSPDGRLAASDASSFESNVAVIGDAAAGTWRVVVAPDAVVGPLRYRGYAAAVARARGPATQTRRELLPNLVAHPLTNLRMTTAPAAGPPPFVWDFRHAVTGPSSCYLQEIAELGARRCLRFDQTVANLGAGALELRARQVGDGPMDQRIYRSDGTVRDRTAGTVRLHLEHSHFHYEDYARVRLYAVAVDGTRGPLVREGRKQGFCLADTRNVRFGQPNQRPAAYVDPVPCDGRNEAPMYSRVGLSPGWADTYPWYIPEQFIEISGVADGRYLLEFSVNEGRALREQRYDDNRTGVVVDLRGDEVHLVATHHAGRTGNGTAGSWLCPVPR